ncbi:phosphatidylglycerophosphatase A (plasmid) [Pontibacillus sp. ALD_SL1]|nr:phosphatidylglycerophosphatase A [Pontibacillus sp. ALD_SL1]
MFSHFFPNHSTKSFLAKGICALVASTAEVLVTGEVEKDYKDASLALLASRGIDMNSLVEMVYDLQSPYNPNLRMDECMEHVMGVLKKQQTYHTIQLCIEIDRGVENSIFGKQFLSIVGNDEGLYGIDECVNTSISKMYGMIAITNFGYLDKAKPGIIGELDSDHEGNHCNTFADDTVCALVSAACARLAYNHEDTESKPDRKIE